MMDDARVKEVFADEKFAKSLLELETPEEVQSALKARGIEASREEILGVRDALVKAIEKGGTLSDEELENVAGGVAFLAAPLIAIVIAATGGAGAAAGGSALTHVLTSGKW
jgi:predicted ribosomally synthesized peptide with nif11-like leader